MFDNERARFFRPWDSSASEVTYDADSTTVLAADRPDSFDKVEEERSSSVYSSCSSSASSSANSADDRSLNRLSSFVRHAEDKLTAKSDSEATLSMSLAADDSTSYTSAAAATEWSTAGSSSAFVDYYQSSLYNWHQYNQANAEYPWMPANYQYVQEAVYRLNHQERVAKQMKKLRPKRFRCQYCDVAFSNNGQLKGHVRIHTGERPFECDHEGCKRSFTRNEELTRHKRIHTGDRPYGCHICQKSFGRKDHLKKHVKTHENKNAYQIAAAVAVAAAASPFAGYNLVGSPTAAGLSPYMYPI